MLALGAISGCGALASFNTYDGKASTVTASPALVPADGHALATVTLQLRYSPEAVAARVGVSFSLGGHAATLVSAETVTDAQGMARATLKSDSPGITFVAVQASGSGEAALTTQVTFVPVAASLAMTVAPLTAVGAAAPATVTVLDSSRQRVDYYTGTLGFTSSDPCATLPTPYTYTAADAGQHTFSRVAFNTLGVQSLTAVDTANANITATQGNIQVSRATIPHFVVSGVQDQLAGTRNQLMVTVLSDANQVLSNYAGTLHVSSSDANAVLPPDTVMGAADAGVKTLPVTLLTAGQQSVTVSDVRNFSVNGTQSGIFVTVAADRLEVNLPGGGVVAGVSAGGQVRAVDAYHNLDTNFQGAITLTTSDLLATLPAPYTLTSRDAGVYTFTWAARTAGVQTVSAADANGRHGSGGVTVRPASISGLSISVPATATAGTAFGAVVTARDPYNNVATQYTGRVTLGSSDTFAALPAAYTFTGTDRGQATLSGVRLSTGGNQTLTVTDAVANLATTSNVIVVAPAQAANFTVIGLTGGFAGHPGTARVTAVDSFGNPVSGYTGTVRFQSSDPNAVLPGDYTFVATEAGRHDFSLVELVTAGNQNVIVYDVSAPAIRGIQTNILITPGSAADFLLVTSPNAVAGVAQSVTITAVDPYNNVDPNFTDQVNLSSSDLAATVPAQHLYAGALTLPVTFYTGGAQSLTATSLRGLVGTLGNINVASGGATQLLVFGVADAVAGQTRTVSVQAADNFNNLVPGYRGKVAFFSTDLNATLPPPTVFDASDAGEVALSVVLTTAGFQNITATDIVHTSITGNQNHIAVTVQADRFNVTTPGAVTAGAPFSLGVAAVDRYGNADPNYTGTVSLATSDSHANLPATVNITSQGNVTVPSVVLYVAGSSESITAQDVARTVAGTRGGIVVGAASAASFTVSAPNPIAVGAPFSTTVTAFDAFGNQATGYRGTVRFFGNDTRATYAAPVQFASSNSGSRTVSGFAWGQASTQASLTALDVAASSITGSANNILVNAGAVQSLRLSGVTGGPAGQNITMTVSAVDGGNNLVSGYTGTVQFSGSDTQALYPSSYRFTAADAGVHTFTVQWRTAGTQTLSVADTADALSVSQGGCVVTPLGAVQLVLVDTTAGLNPTSGVAQSIRVSAADPYGNVDPNFTGSVTLGSSDTAASLPGPRSYASGDAGVATVSVTFNSAGSQSLTAAGPGGIAGTLSPLAVSAAGLTGFTVTNIGNLLAGQGGNVTITAVDGFANPVTGYVGVVRFASSDTAAVLPGPTNFYARDAGSKTLPLTLYTAGLQSVGATDNANPNYTGSANNIHVQVHGTRFKVTAPALVAAGLGFNITVAATDVYGNVDPNYTGNVVLSSSDGAAVLPGGNVVFLSADLGQKTLAGLVMHTAGNNQSISANDIVAGLFGSRIGINVTVGGVTRFEVSAPTSVNAGALFTTGITALDDANNVVTGYSGTLTLSTNNNQAALPATVTLGAGDGGTILVSGCSLALAGTGYGITVRDGNGIVGNQNGITVTALAATRIVLSGATSGPAGHTDTLNVVVADMYGNPARNYTGTVVLGSSDARAVIAQSSYAFGLGDNSAHVFGNLQWYTAGTQAITALDTAHGLAGQQNNVIITGNPATNATVFGLSGAVAATAQNIIVAFTDAYGNIDANHSGTVTLTSTDSAAVFVPASVVIASADAGARAAAASLYTAGTQTVQAAGAGVTSGAQNVLIAPSPVAARLGVSGIANTTAGEGRVAQITAYDAYNNLSTGFVGRVAFSSTDPYAALPAATRFTAGDAGSKSVALTLFTAGTQQVTATQAGNANVTGSQNNIFVAPAGQAFALTGTTSTTAGTTFTMTVTALDNANNIDNNFTGTVHFVSTDPNAILPADTTFAPSDGGQKTISGFALLTLGSQAVMASSASPSASGESARITVNPLPPSAFVLSTVTSTVAGSGFNVTVAAVDVYGNLTPTYTGSVTFSTNDPQGAMPAPAVFDSGAQGTRVVPNFVLRTATGNATLTATDANAGMSGTQGGIAVTPLPYAAAIRVGGATSGVAGHTNAVTVAGLDPYGNVTPVYRGRVAWQSSDPAAALPAGYSFNANDAGSHTFTNVALVTAGNQNLVINDGSFTARQGNIIITAAPATQLGVLTATSQVSGVPQNVTVRALDPYGNVDTAYTQTVTLGSSDPLVVLPGSYGYLLTDIGVHTFSITLASAGTQSVTGTDAAGDTGTQSNIVVVAGAPAKLRVSGIPASLVNQTITMSVRATDAAGNLTSGYRGQVAVSSSDARATLPGNSNFTVADAGTKALLLTFFTTGQQTVTATDMAAAGINGSQNNIAVTSLPTRLVVGAPAQVTAGGNFSVVVAARDNYNNTITGYTGTVSLITSDARATLPATLSFGAGDQGSKTISGALFTTSPNASIAVADSAAGLHGSSNSILVGPGSPNAIVVTAPTLAAAGAAFSLTLTAEDPFGNTATQYAGTVMFGSTDLRATLPTRAVFSASNQGVATVPGFAMLTASPNGTITATDAGTPSVTGTSLPIVITPLAAVRMAVSGATSGAAGHAQVITVAAQDTYGNTATGYTGLVGFGSSDIAAVLPSSYSYGSNEAGTHTFSGLSLVSMGNQSITATDAGHSYITGSQTGILITAGAATHLAMGSATSTTVAGAPVAVALQALDAYNNPDPNYAGSVTIGSSDAHAVGVGAYAFVSGDAGVHNSNITLTTAGAQNITIAGGLPGAQTSFTVTVAPLAQLSVSGIANQAAGTTNTMLLRAVDNYNNTVTTYAGTVRISSSDTNAALPTDHSFQSGELGSRAANLTLYRQGLQWVKAVDTGNTNITGSQNNILVGVNQTRFTVACNTNVIAGVGFNVTVSATDIYGNINPNYTGTVTFGSPDPGAQLPPPAVFASAHQGSRVFTSVVLEKATSAQIISAGDATFSGSQNNIIVNAGAPAGLVLSAPAQATAGSTFGLTASGVDAYGNIAPSYRGNVQFSSSDAGSTLPSPFGFAPSNNGTRVLAGSARLTTSGNQTITMTDVNNAFSASATTAVGSSTPSALVVSLPAYATAGTPVSAVLTAQDIYGNRATTYAGTAALGSSDANASFPPTYAFSPNSLGQVTLSGNIVLRTSGSQVMYIADANNAGISQGSSVITVNAAGIARLSVTAPASVNAEAQYLATVSGLDAYANVVNNYSGTVYLTSTDPNGLPSPTAPVTLTFHSGALARQNFFGLYYVIEGTQTLWAKDSVSPNAIYGNANTMVMQLPVASLVVQDFPSPQVAGQNGNLTVIAVDSYGNITSEYAGTVSFTASDPNRVLPSSYTFQPGDQGQHVFAGVQLHTVGSAGSITATDGNGTTGTQSGIVVTPAAAASLSISGNTNATAGAPTSVTVTAKDAYNNIATGYVGRLHFTSTDPNAALPPDYPFNNGDAGVHAFNNGVILVHAGAQTIIATDANGIFTTRWPIVITGTNANSLAVAPQPTSTAGQPLTTTVTALDIYGNPSVVYRGTVNFSGTDNSGVYLTGYQFTGADQGVHVFNGNVVLKTAGVQTVMASDANAGALVVPGQGNVTVSPNAVHGLRITAPVTVQPSLTFNTTVTGIDAYGNWQPGYTGTVHLTSSDSIGIPSGSSPITLVIGNSNNGQQSTSATHLKTLGARVLYAQDVSVMSLSASANVTVATLAFSAEYDYGLQSDANYTFDASKVSFNANSAYLTPIFTQGGDTAAADFGAGTSTYASWDSTGHTLRLFQTNTHAENAVLINAEYLDDFVPDPNARDTYWSTTSVDPNLGSSNTSGYCCGDTNMHLFLVKGADSGYASRTGYKSLLYKGSALGGGSTYAYARAYNMATAGITLNGNARLSYYIYPEAYDADAGAFVNGDNSAYAALVLLFTDGTTTSTMGALTDANGIVFSPSAQGAGGHLALDTWNYVQVDLSSLAGKQLAAIDVGWQKNGGTLGFLGYVDDIEILGTWVNNQITNKSTLDATWTPRYAGITGYWKLDGLGPIADGATVAATVGANLTAHNADGASMAYVNGHLGQAIFMDGADDYLSHPTANYPADLGNTAMTFAAWIRPLLDPNNWQCSELFSFGDSASQWFFLAPSCYGNGLSLGSAVNGSPRQVYGPGWNQGCYEGSGGWAHAAVTFDGGNANVFLNGMVMYNTNLAGTLLQMVGAHPYFGKANDGALNYAGVVDEMAVWNVALSANEMRTIYERQQAYYADTFVSRAYATPFFGSAATGMDWNTTQPFYKALPGGNTVAETAAQYPALSGNSLNANLIAYYAYEETAFGTAGGRDFFDSSNSNNGSVAFNTYNLTQGVPGRFNNGLYQNGSDGGAIVPAMYANPQVFTQAIWFRTTQNGPLMAFGDSDNWYSANYDRIMEVAYSGIVTYCIQDGCLFGTQSFNDNQWHHAVAVHDHTQTTLYVDGAVQQANLGSWYPQHTNGHWRVGWEHAWQANNWTLQGFLDEAMIFDRALDAGEVLSLYRRGANRIKFQIRTCGSSGCTDNPNWVGYDGTAETYFSELNNAIGPNGAPNLPWLYFANYPLLTVNTGNPYVQYRAILESDDTHTLCTYDGVTMPCSPELTAANLFRVNYDTSAPPVTLSSSALPYYSLNSLAQALGSTGCSVGVKYALSPDGASWFYYNGSAWVGSNRTSAQANTAAALTSSVLGAFSTAYPYGSAFFSALLMSEGVSPCSLQSVTLAGTQ